MVDIDVPGGLSQDVTSLVTRCAVYKSFHPQNSGQFGNIVAAQSFCFTELGNAQAFFVMATGDAYKYAQSVFFLGCYFHKFSDSVCEYKGSAWYFSAKSFLNMSLVPADCFFEPFSLYHRIN